MVIYWNGRLKTQNCIGKCRYFIEEQIKCVFDDNKRDNLAYFLARLHEVQKSYCSHPGRTRSRSRSRSRSTLR